MKKINLLEVIGSIDDELIEKTIETNNKEKLKELKTLEKKKKYSYLLKYTSMLAGGLALFLFTFTLFTTSIKDNELHYQNPIIEVETLEELETFIGFDLSKYQIKEIDTFIKYPDTNMVEIKYQDGSSIRISKEKSDNSGINGSTFKEEQKIHDVTVQIYTLEEENLVYANWQKDDYSYSYLASSNENILEILEKIL